MRMRIAALLGFASLLLFSATTVPPSLLRSDAPALEVEVFVTPVAHDTWQLLKRAQPGMFRCAVLVHDEPGSHRIWGPDDIVLAPGESGDSTTALGPLELRAHASIDRRAERAETIVTVLRDGNVVSRQRSSVWLERPRQR